MVTAWEVVGKVREVEIVVTCTEEDTDGVLIMVVLEVVVVNTLVEVATGAGEVVVNNTLVEVDKGTAVVETGTILLTIFQNLSS